MARIPEEALAPFRRWGRQGGQKAWKGVSKAQRTKIARKAAKTRWRRRNGKTRA